MKLLLFTIAFASFLALVIYLIIRCGNFIEVGKFDFDIQYWLAVIIAFISWLLLDLILRK